MAVLKAKFIMKIIFNYKENIKKESLTFVLIPTIAYLTRFSSKKCYSINIVWLFFDLEFLFEN